MCVLVIFMITNNLNDLYQIVAMFENDNVYKFFMALYVENKLMIFSLIISTIVIYVYILEYIAQHGKLIFNREFDKEGNNKRYILFIQNLYAYFNWAIIPFVLLPFLAHNLVQNSLSLSSINFPHLLDDILRFLSDRFVLEIFSIIFLYYATNQYIIPIIDCYLRIIYSHELLNEFNERKTLNDFLNIVVTVVILALIKILETFNFIDKKYETNESETEEINEF